MYSDALSSHFPFATHKKDEPNLITNATGYGFNGQYSNASDFGLLYFNARWLDPALGRFTQADSIVPAGVQGYNRYAYVSNNPVKNIDPTGHIDCTSGYDPDCSPGKGAKPTTGKESGDKSKCDYGVSHEVPNGQNRYSSRNITWSSNSNTISLSITLNDPTVVHAFEHILRAGELLDGGDL